MAITEIEQVPEGGVGEQGYEDDEQKIIHLYDVFSETACGAPRNDWHDFLHGQRVRWEKGMLSCPVCGAPICMECILRAS